MGEFILSPRAHDDLSEILAYSSREWSDDQADIYIATLLEAFDLLADLPLMGVRVQRLQSGLRQFPCGSHLIFYLPAKGGVDIVRVLHGSRNVRDILSGD